MFSSITALFQMIKELFALKEKNKDKQLETASIKEYQKLVKACEYANDVFEYIEKHNAVNFETLKQQRRYEYLVSKFREKVI